MPVYRYRAQDGTEFEVTQSIHDEPLDSVVGPEGEPIAVRRIIQKPAVVLKGDGWATKS